MIAKPQSVGVNQVLEKIFDSCSVCPFVVQPKILNSLIWMRSPLSTSTTLIGKKKDCMLAIIPFSVLQSILRRLWQILFSSNAVRKRWAGMIGSLLLWQTRSHKTFLENPSMYHVSEIHLDSKQHWTLEMYKFCVQFFLLYDFWTDQDIFNDIHYVVPINWNSIYFMFTLNTSVTIHTISNFYLGLNNTTNSYV